MSADWFANNWIQYSLPRRTRARYRSRRRCTSRKARAGTPASGLTSTTGQPLGTQTYRITISGGAIIDRRHAEAEDCCASETYQPI